MRVDCPECAASVDGPPGQEMVCPACMTPFLVPADRRESSTFEVQAGGGVILHGMSRVAIQEAIYVGRLGSAARVRPEGGEWQLIGGHAEFAAVLRVLGGDLAPMPGTRKLAAWKREDTGDADSVPSRTSIPRIPSATVEPPHTPGVRVPPPRVPIARPPPPEPPRVPTWVIALLVGAILTIIVLGVM